MWRLALMVAILMALAATPARAVVILDPADGVELVGFHHTDGDQHWTVPAGVERVTVELTGGIADEEPDAEWGHLYAAFETKGGEVFDIHVGGWGEDTTAGRGGQLLALGAGSASGNANYISPLSIEGDAWMESEPGGASRSDGWARILYRPALVQPPPLDPSAKTASPAPSCTVPRLQGLKPGVARWRLWVAHCGARQVTRRAARRARRGRVVAQSQHPGAALPAGTIVDLVVGRRP
jgi:hypothetical protein